MTDAKKCTGCFETFPMLQFRFRPERMRYHFHCRACESKNQAAQYKRRKELGAMPVVRQKQTEPTWAVPMHEYSEPDVAMREWRCAMPNLGNAIPNLGMRASL